MKETTTTMANLTLTTFLTLDGVMQAPGGPGEDDSGDFRYGGWLVPYFDEDFGKFMTEVFDRADAFLLGRGTYQIFEGYWPKQTDPKDPIASRLNGLPKHVASRTLERVTWNGSSLTKDVANDVPAIKRKYARELQVHGSAGLAQELIRLDLVDRFNLLIFPVVLGHGKRLFGSGAVPAAHRLTSSRTTSTGVVIATYERAGAPVFGSVAQP
jgi:dihydrofolate reductase